MIIIFFYSFYSFQFLCKNYYLDRKKKMSLIWYGKQIPQKWWTDIEVENNNTHVQNLARKCPRSYLDYFMEQIWLLYDAC
jgi:hypothetical protein